MRHLFFITAAALLAGCAGPPGAEVPRGGSPHPDGSSSGEAPLGEEVDLVQQLLDGQASVDEVLSAVAWADGWPHFDGTTTWFVHPADGSRWALAGDFGDWAPQPMREGEGFWFLGIEGELAPGTGYKFVRDGGEWLADPWARSYRFDDYGELSFAVPPEAEPHLERWPGLEGQGLLPREVVVYVPPGDGPFDVLYAQDGQNLFDPGAIWGGWRLDDALASTPHTMVVGVFNTADRMSEYTHVDDFVLGEAFEARGDAYAALLHDDLRPHIEERYPTSGHDGLLGSSLGGLISLHVAWTYPGEYDFVASMSGTLGWGRFTYDNPTMEERWVADPPPGVVVYVDSGGGAGDDGVCTDPDGDGFPEDDPDQSDNYCETRQLADALASIGFVWEETLFHWHEPMAPHQENAWAERVARPLEIFAEAP